MNRLIGTVVLLLVGVVAAPAIATAAQAAVPTLCSLLILLAVAKLLWPSRRR